MRDAVHGRIVVTPPVDLDVHTASAFREVLIEAVTGPHDEVLLDLSQVAWIDSVGLGVIVAAWKRGRAAGRDVVLWRPSTKAKALLRLARLDQLMTVEDGTDQVPDPTPAA